MANLSRLCEPCCPGDPYCVDNQWNYPGLHAAVSVEHEWAVLGSACEVPRREPPLHCGGMDAHTIAGDFYDDSDGVNAGICSDPSANALRYTSCPASFMFTLNEGCGHICDYVRATYGDHAVLCPCGCDGSTPSPGPCSNASYPDGQCGGAINNCSALPACYAPFSPCLPYGQTNYEEEQRLLCQYGEALDLPEFVVPVMTILRPAGGPYAIIVMPDETSIPDDCVPCWPTHLKVHDSAGVQHDFHGHGTAADFANAITAKLGPGVTATGSADWQLSHAHACLGNNPQVWPTGCVCQRILFIKRYEAILSTPTMFILGVVPRLWRLSVSVISTNHHTYTPWCGGCTVGNGCDCLYSITRDGFWLNRAGVQGFAQAPQVDVDVCGNATFDIGLSYQTHSGQDCCGADGCVGGP